LCAWLCVCVLRVYIGLGVRTCMCSCVCKCVCVYVCLSASACVRVFECSCVCVCLFEGGLVAVIERSDGFKICVYLKTHLHNGLVVMEAFSQVKSAFHSFRCEFVLKFTKIFIAVWFVRLAIAIAPLNATVKYPVCM